MESWNIFSLEYDNYKRQISKQENGEKMSQDNTSKKEMSFIAKTLLVLSTFAVMAISIFYFALWRVPDKTEEIDKVIKKISDRDSLMDSFSPEHNGWTYYNQAMKRFNPSPMDTATRAGVIEPPPDNSLIDEKESLEIIGEAYDNNKEALELADRALTKEKSFLYPDPPIPRGGAGTLNNELDNLSRFLIFAGDYELSRGKLKDAATRYLQSLDMLKSNSQRHFFTPEIYNNTYDAAFFRLSELIENNPDNKALQNYINEKTDRLTGNMQDYDIYAETYILFLKHNRKDVEDFLKMEIQNSLSSGQFQIVTKHIPVHNVSSREVRIIQNLVYSYLYKNPFKITPQKHPMSLVSMDGEVIGSLKDKYNEYAFLEAKIQGIRLTTALQLYDIDHGKYPDQLSLLVPEYIQSIPEDPYLPGSEFIYRKKAKGHVEFFSVGSDRKNDNGSLQMDNAGSPGDVVFKLKREKKQKKKKADDR